ncbi:hypothetical protein M0805_002806 [Coniferiporia weirii]|nr:hypothetical protein M0805_002806 [Coniferiporia weirii]
MEALHFHPPQCTVGYNNWHTAGIQITPTTIIKPTNPLRWLGIWWDPSLSFKAHVKCMRSKGLSTLAALHILGNTERRISALLLHQLYSACIHTMLAWGAPIWFHGRSQKTLARVQHVQQVPAYTHPPWMDPLAFGQGQINFEVPPIPVPSKSSPMDLTLGWTRVATATDAEIFSLAGAPGWAASHLHDHLSDVLDIHFLSNSLTAINLFRTWPSASGAQLLPTWKAGMQTLLNSYPGLTVHFAWCPSHLDIPGNEWADAEAKAATDLPPSSLAPSISTLKEQSMLVARTCWSHQLACPLTLTVDKYLAICGPPTCMPRKLLMLLVDHPCCELSAVAQVLCHAGPYGGYWLSFDSVYQRIHVVVIFVFFSFLVVMWWTIA